VDSDARRGGTGPSFAKWSAAARLKIWTVLLVVFVAYLVGLLAYNGWLLAKGSDPWSHPLGLIRSITVETQIAIAIAVAKLAVAMAGLFVAARVLRRLLAVGERRINRWDQLASDNESLARLFKGLDRLIVTTAWALLALYACAWFGLPQGIGDTLLLALRIYLVISIGFNDHRVHRRDRRHAQRPQPAHRADTRVPGLLQPPASAPAHLSHLKGVVEAIEFRTTKIRDSEGRLHMIRNGAIKPVINYSEDYTIAVVPVEVAYGADLRSVFNTLRTAGERVRADDPDVLADTNIEGITASGNTTMTVRTSTRVKPGRHEARTECLKVRKRASPPERSGGEGARERRRWGSGGASPSENGLTCISIVRYLS